MENSDRISGKRIYQLFDQIEKDRTSIKLVLLGKDYERLTIVTGIKNEKGVPYLLIDYPIGFRETVQDFDGGKIIFEFIGGDNIPYSFKTAMHKISGEDIWVRFPESIERIQRRKYFRIAPPLGTKIIFTLNNREYETNVVNLSHGGALVNQKEKSHKDSDFYVDEYIKNIDLVNREKNGKIKIGIKKTVIIRIFKSSETGKYNYALRFMDMEKKEEDKLDKYMYECQRAVLKKRSMLVDD